MKYKILSAAVVFFSYFFSNPVTGQDLLYRVYQVETPYQGHLNANFWTTGIINSPASNEHFGKMLPDKGLLGSSLELEYGLFDHVELSAYADFVSGPNQNFMFTKSHYSLMYRIGERFDHFINMAVYAEYYLPRKSYAGSQEAELRLILDKDIEDFRIAANPYLSKYTTGEEDKKPEFGLSAGIYYRRGNKVQPGLEYYANYKENTGVLFPTVVLYFTPRLIWNVGAGFGLTDGSDRFIIKSLLQVDLQVIRPSKLLRKRYEPSPLMH